MDLTTKGRRIKIPKSQKSHTSFVTKNIGSLQVNGLVTFHFFNQERQMEDSLTGPPFFRVH